MQVGENLRWRSAQVSASGVRILLSSSGTFSKNLRRGRLTQRVSQQAT